MIELYFFGTICITLILVFYFLYKLRLPKNYDNIIKEKQNKIAELDNEINQKSNINNSLDNNGLLEIKHKLEILEIKLDNKSNDSLILLIIVIICTGIILYFTYKWTYYIQPNTINKLINNVTQNFLQ